MLADVRDSLLGAGIYVRSLLVFGCLWYLSARWIDNAQLLPQPQAMLAQWLQLTLSGEIPSQILISVRRLAIGYVAAAVLALPLGLGMALCHWRSLPIVRHVLLPGALPASLVGARLALGSAWRSLILAELLVGARSSQGNAGGIGALMFTLYSYQVNLSGIIACMLVAGLVGFALDAGGRALAARTAPWATV